MLKNGFSYEDILKVLGDDVDLSTIKEWEAELLAAQTWFALPPTQSAVRAFQ